MNNNSTNKQNSLFNKIFNLKNLVRITTTFFIGYCIRYCIINCKNIDVIKDPNNIISICYYLHMAFTGHIVNILTDEYFNIDFSTLIKGIKNIFYSLFTKDKITIEGYDIDYKVYRSIDPKKFHINLMESYNNQGGSRGGSPASSEKSE